MPLPFLIMGAIGSVFGPMAAKGVSKIREFINEGETINCYCYNCNDYGPHNFAIIDRSWAAGAGVGFFTGGIGGSIAGFTAKKIFRCNNCGRAIYSDGSRPGWNADQAIQAFFGYDELKVVAEELQEIVSSNQKIAKKYTKEIERLESELQDVKSDKQLLKEKISNLIAKIKSNN